MPSVVHVARVVLGVAAVAFVLLVAMTASNVVPSTRAGGVVGPGPTANELKPAECAALDLTVIVVGGGSGGQAALVLGTAGNDNLTGAAGGDRVLPRGNEVYGWDLACIACHSLPASGLIAPNEM